MLPGEDSLPLSSYCIDYIGTVIFSHPMPPTLENEDSTEEALGIKQVPPNGISLDVPSQGDNGRPPNLRHMYRTLNESMECSG